VLKIYIQQILKSTWTTEYKLPN